MAWLLIDNSNSRTKFAVGDRDRLHGWRAIIPTAALDQKWLDGLLAGIDFSAVIVASVVPDKAAFLTDYFHMLPKFHLIGYQSPLEMEFDLPKPDQIGSDRMANAVGMKKLYGCPGIAIDFGTAVTFSYVSAEGNFSGGAIAPGMAVMTKSLGSHTALLPEIVLNEPDTAIGKSTLEAMRIGAVIGSRGMVREILRAMIAEIGTKPVIVATGGGAEFASRGLGEIDVIDPNLTLEGLRLIAGRVFQ